MKKKFGLSMAALGSLMLTVASCGKDDNKAKPICKMSSIVETGDNGTISRVIGYDEGKMVSVVTAGGDGSSKIFSYSAGMITVISKNKSGVVTGTDEVLLNASGRIKNITKKNAAGTTTGTDSYVYNTAGQMVMSISAPVVGTADTTAYVYNGGNVTVSTHKGKNTLYTYYGDKTFTDGDFVKLIQILNTGALAVENKNLLKSVVSPEGAVTEFAYRYDNVGKITRLIISGGADGNYSYTYDCR